MNESQKVIVVGGGLAGLVATTRLARSGARVTQLEAAATLGGRARTDVRGGFALNQGPHALYEGGRARRELAELGIDPQRWNPVSHRSVFVRDGRLRRSPGGLAGLGRLLLAARKDPTGLAGRSTAEWIDSTLASSGARRGARAAIRVATFVADHDELSADVAASQLRLAALGGGVRYVRDGWRAIVDSLADAAIAAGADIRTGAAVRGLRRQGDGWDVQLDSDVLRADAVVLAVGDPAAFAELAGERAPAAPGPPAELSALDIGLERLPRRGRTFALGVDSPHYLSKHSPPDQRDGALLSLASYGRRTREELEGLADTVQPGWRDAGLTLDRYLPRMLAVSSIATPAAGGLAGRPAVRRGENLFLAGDWIGPEGWLADAAVASGAGAADAIIGAAERAPALA